MTRTLHSLQRIETFAQEIKKSRFRALAGPVDSEQAVRDFIAAYADTGANHNCWAWRVGQAYRFSDDGEPSGTAGKPILQAIDGQALDGVAVVVTRWFGGILLGSGGLMRAYGGTAATCLRVADKQPIVLRLKSVIRCPFSDFSLVKSRLLGCADVRIDHEAFVSEGVELTLALPQADLAAILAMVVDLTAGRVVILGEDEATSLSPAPSP
ncbi:YigZ family protein [Rhizobium sp. CG5]|uniref:IMPACT family protein n=1 Tax=Rhizobium sp. CG5 TaxID=2726076 RepID=UPI0020335EA9|nr:YigZ family protein [Rhizobium sp. CG5]MCM2477189.1 YigZ family protein [Rhizobium sp. CG5]